MTENRFWNLLAKKLAGEASDQDLHELEILLKSNPSWIHSAEVMENLWQISRRKEENSDAELAFELHIDQLEKAGISMTGHDIPNLPSSEAFPTKPTPKRRAYLYSLSLVSILCLVFFIWQKGLKQSPVLILTKKNPSEISTRFGSKSKLILPDSSVVWLNAGSKLTYDENFGATNRNTTLTGEAYFEVRKMSTPFIIHANTLKIKVLGTAFNVKSYPDERTTETTLIRGRVEITHEKRPGEVFILKPNEKLTIVNEPEEKTESQKKSEPKVVLSSLTHTPDNVVLETSWVENKLIFQDESFADVAKKMERWYNVSIEIKNEALAQMHVGGGPFENETIQQALVALQIAFNFNFIINGNHVIITR